MINWVIGSNGLLGSSVNEELGKLGPTWQPNSRIEWADTGDQKSIAIMEQTIDSAVEEFVNAQVGLDWNIFWCAGVGVVNSPNELLELEVIAATRLCSSLVKFNIPENGNGKIFFASSAGGVYAGSSNPPFTESSIPVPISNYGRQKLRIEELFNSFGKNYNVKIVIGRIANLYGVKQNLRKQQGLITTLIRSSLTNSFLNIYVPLNTVRNYIYTADAARKIVWHVLATDESLRIAVICSDKNLSLSSILRLTQDVTKKKLLYFQSSSEATSIQPIDLRLDTEYPLSSNPETPIVVGISNVRLHLFESLQRGVLV